MNTLFLGDTLVYKFATETYNPKRILLSKGLDTLEEELPESAANLVRDARTLPEKLVDSLKSMFRTEDLGAVPINGEKPPELKSASETIDNEDKLVKSMNQLALRAKELKRKMKHKHDTSKNSPSFYIDDDMSVTLGPSYFVPPDLTP